MQSRAAFETRHETNHRPVGRVLGQRLRPLVTAWRPLTVVGVGLLVGLILAGWLLTDVFDRGALVRWDTEVGPADGTSHRAPEYVGPGRHLAG